MRWVEIVNENSVVDKARSAILSLLAPLKSQGTTKVSVDQILSNLRANPEFEGINLDANFVMDATKGLKAVYKIQPDPEADGKMMAYLDTPVGTRQVDAKTAEKEKAAIKKSAVNQAKKNIKGM